MNRTFTEFVDMMNKEDPVIIEGLYLAAIERIKAMYGQGGKGKSSNRNVGLSGNKYKKYEYDPENRRMSKSYLEKFLKEWGATNEELKAAEEKIKSGKVKIPTESYDWVTADKLEDMSEKEFRELLRKMGNDNNNSIKIEVSLDKRRNKNRKR